MLLMTKRSNIQQGVAYWQAGLGYEKTTKNMIATFNIIYYFSNLPNSIVILLKNNNPVK